MTKSTILLEKETRQKLRKAGYKGQTYDEIIKELLQSKKSLEISLDNPVSRESIIGGS
jgi:hypothetical protein